MLKSSFEFEVLVHGSSVKEYYHRGSTYIEGKEGTNFSLRMRNNTGSRVLFVPTVDGLSILNGKHGSFGSRGYIVRAYDSLTIDGWRTSDDNIAEFFFSSPIQSYAKKIHKGNNLGVIGCVVCKEKYQPVYFPPAWAGSVGNGSTTGTQNINTTYSMTSASQQMTTAFSAMNCSNNSASASLGTGFGQDKYSPVTSVDFDKEVAPSEIFNIFYNTRAALQSMGIEFNKPIYISKSNKHTGPSAFPNEEGYCPRP